MKRWSMLSCIAVILLSLSVESACAQGGDSRQTSGGFWVVESNLATPRMVTVRFYEEGNRLIYEEHLAGVRMNISRRRTRRKLDQSLCDARAVWMENRLALEDRGLVAARFGVSWDKVR